MDVGFVWNENHAGHGVAGHPERPERLDAVVALLRSSGLLDRLVYLDARDASDDELAWVHPAEHLAVLSRACDSGGGYFDPDTYVTPRSCAAARAAAGAALEATEAVLSGRAGTAFAAVRPPGHHARPAQAMGFCLLNNVALAVQHARRAHGLERLAVIDIDVHHGNGTQDAFYSDPNVLYVSTHQYPFYPGTGPARETGEVAGAGANVNIPLPAGCGDGEYALVFEQLVEPVLRRFRPQALFVSCGFDAHFSDPLAGMALSIDGYGAVTERLAALAGELCAGRAVYLLEGGYDLDAVAWGVRRVLEVLLALAPTPDPHGVLADARAVHIEPLIAELRELHGL